MSDSNEEKSYTHTESQQDHAQWLGDISRWRVDHRKALALVARLQAKIYDLDSEMEAHAAAIRDHHLAIMQHKRALDEGDLTDDERKRIIAKHREMNELHEDVEEHHKGLRDDHEELMNDIGALYDALQWDEVPNKSG
ncbi:MAG: hypothetical protein ACQEVA_03045 [Myxococcota bacterium]